MTMKRIEQCGTCYYYLLESRWCYRFPHAEEHAPRYWCGEWKVDNEKTCGAESPPLPPDPTITLVRETLTALGQPMKPRKSFCVPCLLEKNHEGKHSWEKP